MTPLTTIEKRVEARRDWRWRNNQLSLDWHIRKARRSLEYARWWVGFPPPRPQRRRRMKIRARVR